MYLARETRWQENGSFLGLGRETFYQLGLSNYNPWVPIKGAQLWFPREGLR